MERHSNKIKDCVFWLVVAILVFLSFMIVRPYIIALVSAFVLAFLTRPLHILLKRKVGSHIAALLCVISIIIIVVLPSVLIFGELASQASSSVTFDQLSSFIEDLSSSPVLQKFGINLLEIKQDLASVIISILKSTLSALPSVIISIAIALFAIFVMLINWEYLITKLENFIPFEDKRKIRKEIGDITYQIVYGYLLIALLEFFVSLIGFWISGVKYFILLPALIAIFAFIPGLGPALVWVPLALYSFSLGEVSTAIGVLITGLILTIGIDTFLSAQIIGTESRIHPLILLLGILGGVPILGIFGFIIGPLLLVYTIKLIEESM